MKMSRIAALAVIILSFSLAASANAAQAPKAGIQAKVESREAKIPVAPHYRFIDGSDWLAIDGIGKNPQDVMEIKILVIKTLYESGIFTGTPTMTMDGPMLNYIKELDAFYKDKNNEGFPVFYALKILEQYKKGASMLDLENYKKMLMERLTKAGVIGKK